MSKRLIAQDAWSGVLRPLLEQGTISLSALACTADEAASDRCSDSTRLLKQEQKVILNNLRLNVGADLLVYPLNFCQVICHAAFPPFLFVLHCMHLSIQLLDESGYKARVSAHQSLDINLLRLC